MRNEAPTTASTHLLTLVFVALPSLIGGCPSELPGLEKSTRPGLTEDEAGPVDGDGEGEGEEPARGPEPFEIRRDQPTLLPFWVRQQRLAEILDLPATDSVFAPLVSNRLLLGDSDHAAGVAPDLQWSPAKMALWARVLRPVCAHPNLGARHPVLSIDLARAAWGRDVTVDELAGIKDDLDAVGLTGDARDEATCIAILSSLEFVAS